MAVRRERDISRKLQDLPMGTSTLEGIHITKGVTRNGISRVTTYHVEGYSKPCNLRWAVRHMLDLLRDKGEDDE